MHILFIEDEAKIANFVNAGLKEHGFVVDYCDNGDQGYQRAIDNEYDVVLLDIMVPGKDGLAILKSLRQAHRNVPVILLTARNELDDRIAGLNLGADDYIAKPFFVEELVARIHAIHNDTRTKMDAVLTAEQRQQLQQSSPDGEERRGRGFPRINGMTDAQRTQMREIRSASRQQMDAVLTAEQKAQIQAIRQDTKTKMDAVLTDQQRQQLEELRQQKRQDRQQRQS